MFLDVIEKLNMLVGANGNIIKSEIVGKVQAKILLTGMPDLKLGLNDKAYFEAQNRTTRSRTISFDDMKFH